MVEDIRSSTTLSHTKLHQEMESMLAERCVALVQAGPSWLLLLKLAQHIMSPRPAPQPRALHPDTLYVWHPKMLASCVGQCHPALALRGIIT